MSQIDVKKSTYVLIHNFFLFSTWCKHRKIIRILAELWQSYLKVFSRVFCDIIYPKFSTLRRQKCYNFFAQTKTFWFCAKNYVFMYSKCEKYDFCRICVNGVCWEQKLTFLLLIHTFCFSHLLVYLGKIRYCIHMQIFNFNYPQKKISKEVRRKW